MKEHGVSIRVFDRRH